MSEWWKYHISDFLLFSPRTYYRMIERHNEAVWPGQLVTLALGVGILVLLYRPAPERRPIIAGSVGVGLFLFSLAVYPLLAPLLGRGWRQAELFGVAPDPTVLATLGLLLMAEQSPRWWTLVVPLAWCLMTGALLWAMGSPELWILVIAAILVLGARHIRRSDAPSTTGA